MAAYHFEFSTLKELVKPGSNDLPQGWILFSLKYICNDSHEATQCSGAALLTSTLSYITIFGENIVYQFSMLAFTYMEGSK